MKMHVHVWSSLDIFDNVNVKRWIWGHSKLKYGKYIWICNDKKMGTNIHVLILYLLVRFMEFFIFSVRSFALSQQLFSVQCDQNALIKAVDLFDLNDFCVLWNYRHAGT